MKKRFMVDDPERKLWQDPEKILDSIGLSPGMVFVDIGCGEGYFSIPAARRVGPGGKVYAIDSNPERIAALIGYAAKEGLDNIFAAVKPAEEFTINNGSVDLIFFGICLHDFRDADIVLANAKEMLKFGGILIDLDWKDEIMDLGPPREIRFSVEKAKLLINKAGFKIRFDRDCGPYHYLICAGL